MVSRSTRNAVLIGIGSAALALLLAAQSRLPAKASQQAEAMLPDPATAPIAALGFDALAADGFWLRAVQVVGDEEPHPGDIRLIGRLTELVVGLDPWVSHPYRFGALWTSDDPTRIHAANRLLERGIAYHPRDWRNRFYLSFNHFFYLGDNEAAARELERAIDLEKAPPYLGRLLARLRSQLGGLEIAAAYLEELLRETEDPWRKSELEKGLDEVETERRARLLDRARDVFRERNGRDIESVDDLVRGPGAVLAALPPELHGWEWKLDPKTGAIVSSFYERRYQLHFQDGVERQAMRGGNR